MQWLSYVGFVDIEGYKEGLRSGMRILLIDIDSKIPNLALMKLSTWHKKQGVEVFLNDYLCNPDKVYVSCVFTKNAYKVKQLPFENMEVGGSGWDLKKELSPS
ncbi:unnamed protein product, partial [marine sediment metagenome]